MKNAVSQRALYRRKHVHIIKLEPKNQTKTEVKIQCMNDENDDLTRRIIGSQKQTSCPRIGSPKIRTRAMIGSSLGQKLPYQN